MTERHLEVLSKSDFEAPELETAVLNSIDSPRHPLDDALFESVRSSSREFAK